MRELLLGGLSEQFWDARKSGLRILWAIAAHIVEQEEGVEIARRAVAARFGIPAAALEIVETEPIFKVLTLRQRVDPSPGGVEIGFSGFLCPLGFVIKQGLTNGFVTNSHCTDTQGGVENTAYFQPFSRKRIGTEIKDPEYTTGDGCPNGRRCLEITTW